MHITINGQPRECQISLNVQQLVEELELDRTRVAIEHNRVIIPASRYHDVTLAEGDEIEIVEFIGGG